MKRLLAFSLAMVLSTCHLAPAAIRSDLITRLNQITDDADGRKMSQANKVAILDQVGREYGRRGLYIKRDTIVTSANVETYALNTDFAGGIQSIYLKRGAIRKGVVIVDRDSAFRSTEVSSGVITYAFIDEDGTLGVHSIPLKADTLILFYFAYPAALSGDGVEWALPDHYEDAALFHAAARILFKIGTAESQNKSAIADHIGDSLLSELRNPPTQTRQLGVSVR